MLNSTRTRLPRLLAVAALAALFGTQSVSADSARFTVVIRHHDGTPFQNATIALCPFAYPFADGGCYSAPLSHSGQWSFAAAPSEFFVRTNDADGNYWWYDPTAPGGAQGNPSKRQRFASLDDWRGRTVTITLPAPPTRDITYHLKPGVNLVGWAGSDTTALDLFRQARSVSLISNVKTGATALRVFGREPARAVPIKYGDPLWVFLSGQSHRSITFSSPLPPRALPLLRGDQYVAWVGPDDTHIDTIRLSLGSFASNVAIVSANDPNERPTSVDMGGVLRVSMTRPLDWALPRGLGPTVIPLISNWADYAPDLHQHINYVVDYYWSMFGVSAEDHRVYFAPTWAYEDGSPASSRPCCFASPRGQWINQPALFDHEYGHMIQYAMASGGGWPGWYVEGLPEYMRYFMLREGDKGALTELAEKWVGDNKSRLEENISIYSLGFAAILWLSENVGPHAPFDILRAMDLTKDFAHGFRIATGLSLREFYQQFNSYQAEVWERNPIGEAVVLVEWSDGQPAVGVTVMLWKDNWGKRATAQGQGRFTISNEFGRYGIEIRFGAGQLLLHAPDAVDGTFMRYPVDLGDSPVVVELVLADVSWVRGKVTFENGNPAASAYVTVVGEIGSVCWYPDSVLPDCWPKGPPILSAWTDNNGEFALPVPNGRYQFGVARDVPAHQADMHWGYYAMSSPGRLAKQLTEASFVEVSSKDVDLGILVVR